jgi:hypothetical protein
VFLRSFYELFCIFEFNRLVFQSSCSWFTDESLRFIESFSERLKSKQKGPIVAELPELFRLKCANDRYTADTNSYALQTEQSFGLSSLRPIQPRFNRIEAGLPRAKASLEYQYSSSTSNLQIYKYYYKPYSN